MTLFPSLIPDLDLIINAVCEAYGITEYMLTAKKGKGRNIEKVAIAKQVICYLWGLHKPANYRVLVYRLSYANHTRITVNRKLTIRIMSVDQEFRDMVNNLNEIIKKKATAVTAAIS